METLRYILFVLLLLPAFTSFGQSFQNVDEVPHDIAYYRESRITKPLIKVLYGRPSVKDGQQVFGKKVPFNQLWRTGANEATEIKVYQDFLFGNIPVKAGTYVLYTIPGAQEWEIILSKNTDVFGAFQYDPIFDIAKIKVSVSKAEQLNTFSIAFKKAEENAVKMILGWGATRVNIPINFNEEDYLVKTVKKQKLPLP